MKNPKTEVVILVSGGLVQSVHSNQVIDVTVIDLDTDDPDSAEEVEKAADELEQRVQRGELREVW